MKVAHSEEAGWLGKTTLDWSQNQQADVQVRVWDWVAEGHMPTAQERKYLISSGKKLWQQWEQLAVKNSVLLQGGLADQSAGGGLADGAPQLRQHDDSPVDAREERTFWAFE